MFDRKARRLISLAFSASLVGCSHPAPQTAPVPEPVPVPVVTPAPMLAPATAAGAYQLHVEIQSGNRPPARNRRDVQPSMTLLRSPATTRTMGGPETQLGATITIPGYTRPVRRGQAQPAAWWPAGGDSLVVQFAQGQQSRGEVQLRGALHGASVQGEIWYVSSETGNTFQLGTFSATKSAR